MGFFGDIGIKLFGGDDKEKVNPNISIPEEQNQQKELEQKKDLTKEAEILGFKELSSRISANLKEIDEKISSGYFFESDKEYIQMNIQKLLSELADKKITAEELERINQDYQLLFEKISIPSTPEINKNINPDSTKEESDKIFESSTKLYEYVLKILGFDKKNIDEFVNKQREQVEKQLNM